MNTALCILHLYLPFHYLTHCLYPYTTPLPHFSGMFKSLDEEARIPKGTSKTWFDKLKRGAKLANGEFL